MAWTYLKAGDAISGKEGELYATIDGEVTQVAECRNITATITKNKVDFKSLGHRGTQHKATGWDGSGSMTVYYVSSKWAKMLIDYAKDGTDVYFKLTIKNSDPTSSIGTQNVTLMDVNINGMDIAKLDTDADFLDASIDFTFSDVEMLSSFDDSVVNPNS